MMVNAANALGPVVGRVYTALAERTNGDGTCFPSMATIARDATVARSNVPRALGQLRAAGLVEVVEGGGGRSSNTYRLPLVTNDACAEIIRVSSRVKTLTAEPVSSPARTPVITREDTCVITGEDAASSPSPGRLRVVPTSAHAEPTIEPTSRTRPVNTARSSASQPPLPPNDEEVSTPEMVTPKGQPPFEGFEPPPSPPKPRRARDELFDALALVELRAIAKLLGKERFDPYTDLDGLQASTVGKVVAAKKKIAATATAATVRLAVERMLEDDWHPGRITCNTVVKNWDRYTNAGFTPVHRRGNGAADASMEAAKAGIRNFMEREERRRKEAQ